jgi:hypothetical protein
VHLAQRLLFGNVGAGQPHDYVDRSRCGHLGDEGLDDEQDEEFMTVEDAPPRAGRREWIGLAVLALPTLLVSLDLFVMLPQKVSPFLRQRPAFMSGANPQHSE